MAAPHVGEEGGEDVTDVEGVPQVYRLHLAEGPHLGQGVQHEHLQGVLFEVGEA